MIAGNIFTLIYLTRGDEADQTSVQQPPPTAASNSTSTTSSFLDQAVKNYCSRQLTAVAAFAANKTAAVATSSVSQLQDLPALTVPLECYRILKAEEKVESQEEKKGEESKGEENEEDELLRLPIIKSVPFSPFFFTGSCRL